MSLVGRAILDQALVRRLGETPEAIAYRLRSAKALEILTAERGVKYPSITAENVREVVAWQETRLAEIHAALLKGAP